MNPNDIIETLKKMGVNISRKTLYNYEQWGLVSAPTFRNSRNTDYLNCVIEEAFVAWRLLHGEYGNEDMKIFFAGKLPILSPNAVFAIKNFNHQKDVKESLSFLRRKLKKYTESTYFFRQPPKENSSFVLEKEIEEIVESAIRNSVDCTLPLEEENLQVAKSVHAALERKIQQLTINGRKRYLSVLMVCGDLYGAVSHEEEEEKICKELYGSYNNVLKNVYNDIYIQETERARELFKTL